MMRNLSGFTCTCYRAVFFSLVTAPSIALFIGFILLSFNNSLADTFLTEARGLIGNAPVDKVQVCIPKNTKEKNSDVNSLPSPPVNVNQEPCETTLIDAISWKKSVDSTIRQLYWFVVFFGFITWCFSNGVLHQVINRVALMLEKKKQ